MTLPNKIKSALQEIVLAVLQVMQDDVSNSKVPLRAASELKITSATSFELPDKIKPDYGMWLIFVLHELEKQPPYAAFCKAMDEHPQISKQLNTMVSTTEFQRRIDHDDVIRSFVWRYLEKINYQLEFDQDVFDTVYQELLDCFNQPSFETTFTAVLEHFDTDIDSLEVLPGIFIRKLSSEEVEELWNGNMTFREHYRPYSSNTISPMQLKGVIETRITSEKIIGDEPLTPGSNQAIPSSVARQSFEMVLTALRLLKVGSVNIGPIHSNPKNWLFEIGGSTSKLKYSLPLGNPYFLSNADVSELKKMVEALRTIEKGSNKSLEIALRRLGYATERINHEDKLIDAMIAFEAMILSDVGEPQERGELRFRLSLRVTHLLGGDRTQMENNFKLMKKAYDLRSKVVHGDLLTPDEIKNVDMALELCRQSARELVFLQANGKSPKWTQWLFE